ncbi:Glyoxalase/Bleomycin resistance protein/Dioxygenase superfamily protein [Yoonia tamlensis]|uniref:Glyoxalase/Bleomycin resistance protein/Dioxygenase superfamily protein n=1 Tax=Yoonia tamlensis TaxID=390270 RepID=A0A1I6HMY9_9RHOB|nr:VOC family protein [Yoonia tamlensis]SFR55758.1 Glyoxalase/Bleomycin resistance protein/Dioxygenase superfamily protein [Yoonia tamlensis]
MAETTGLNHLGLAVRDLAQTTAFFTDALGFDEIGRDETYPRTTVTDGTVRLTLWQTDAGAAAFDRRANIGLHHLALTVPSEAALMAIAQKLSATPGVRIAFMPEPMGAGPRKHMMLHEPGGIRIELVWPGA